jgi:hypothetical protein
MKTASSFDQCYNGQLAVDEAPQMADNRSLDAAAHRAKGSRAGVNLGCS